MACGHTAAAVLVPSSHTQPLVYYAENWTSHDFQVHTSIFTRMQVDAVHEAAHIFAGAACSVRLSVSAISSTD